MFLTDNINARGCVTNEKVGKSPLFMFCFPSRGNTVRGRWWNPCQPVGICLSSTCVLLSWFMIPVSRMLWSPLLRVQLVVGKGREEGGGKNLICSSQIWRGSERETSCVPNPIRAPRLLVNPPKCTQNPPLMFWYPASMSLVFGCEHLTHSPQIPLTPQDQGLSLNSECLSPVWTNIGFSNPSWILLPLYPSQIQVTV